MKKKEFKNMRRGLGTSGTTSNIPTSESWRVPEEKRMSKKLNTSLKNNAGELPQSAKGNRLSGSPGSSESSKEVGPKKAHTKAHKLYYPRLKIRRES